MQVTETQVARAAPADAATHTLEPGDVCEAVFKCKREYPEPEVYGVVIRSRSNSDQIVLVKFGAEPIRDYRREDLKWVGEVE